MSGARAPSPAARAVLDDDLARFGARYQGGLSNHLPMTILAASALGQGDDALARFAADYRARLAPLDDEERAARAAEVARIGAQGRTARLVEVVGAHAGHAFADAFHGLIRTRYALLTDDAGDLAAGLVAWTSARSPLAALAAVPAGPQPFDACARALARVALVPAASHRITERLAALTDERAFTDVAVALAPGGTERDFLVVARVARALYATVDDFVSLHALTGAEAALALARILPDDERAALYRATAQAVLACVAVAGRALDDVAVVEGVDLAAVERALVLGRDDHLPKLVFTLRVLDDADPDPRWAALAHDRVRRGHA